MARKVISIELPDIHRIADTKQSCEDQEMSASVNNTGSPSSKYPNEDGAEYVTDRDAREKARDHHPQTFAAVGSS